MERGKLWQGELGRRPILGGVFCGSNVGWEGTVRGRGDDSHRLGRGGTVGGGKCEAADHAGKSKQFIL